MIMVYNELKKTMIISNDTRNKTLWSLLLILIGVLSFTKVGDFLSNPETYKITFSVLDGKKDFVFTVASSSTIASFLIALIPGDATTPIANQFVNMSSYLMIILVILLFEKYMQTIIAALVFRIIIPIVCLFRIVCIYISSEKKSFYKQILCKVVMVSFIIVSIIPISVTITKAIDNTYEISMKETITEIEHDDSNNVFAQISEFAGNAKNKITNWLHNTIEYIAVMIVTSCLIPLATLFILIWIVNQIFKFNIKLPSLKSASNVIGSKITNVIDGTKSIIKKDNDKKLLVGGDNINEKH